MIFELLVGGGLDVEGFAERGAVGGTRTLVVLFVVLEPLLLEYWDFEHDEATIMLENIKELNLLLPKNGHEIRRQGKG